MVTAGSDAAGITADPGSSGVGDQAPLAHWIAVDWGTSNLRLWAMDADDRVLAERRSDRGMGSLAPDDFETALLMLCAPMLAPGRVTDVLICGMAGARQGWTEAPYADVPCVPAGLAPVTAPARDPRLNVRILPGLAQAAPADVMRGEETQIAGYLAGDPDFDGTLCLPGTHTKWVRIGGGQIRNFATAMTGETYALMSGQSVLRHSMDQGWNDAAFAAALSEMQDNPGRLLQCLFGIRPAGLLAPQPQGFAPARLSGLLIGAELAGARPYWDGLPVVVIGSPALSTRYADAIAQLGGTARLPAPGDLALSGLIAARARLTETRT